MSASPCLSACWFAVCSWTHCIHASNTLQPTTPPAGRSRASRQRSPSIAVGRSSADLSTHLHARIRPAASTPPANDSLYASSRTHRAAQHAIPATTAPSGAKVSGRHHPFRTTFTPCQTTASGTPRNACVAVLRTPACIVCTAGPSVLHAPHSCCNADTRRATRRTVHPARHVWVHFGSWFVHVRVVDTHQTRLTQPPFQPLAAVRRGGSLHGSPWAVLAST